MPLPCYITGWAKAWYPVIRETVRLREPETAQLAIGVASHLRVPDDLRNDYLSSAHAALGNALRIAANFVGAEMAFNTAWALRDEGTADPLVDALIYRYEGSFYAELGRYDEAERSFQNAIIEYAHAGDEHLQGRTLLSRSSYAIHYDPLKAIEYLGRANVLYDPTLEPLLDWCSRHNEIWSLNELGKPEAALLLLEDSRDLYNTLGRSDLWVRARMYWIEARIAFNLGHVKEAEAILTMLFQTLDNEGNHPVDLTLVAVDLLQAIAAQLGRQADIVSFADKLLPLLRNLGLHDQGRVVMLLLRDALVKGVVDGVGWKRIKNYYRRNWHSPLPEPPKIT